MTGSCLAWLLGACATVPEGEVSGGESAESIAPASPQTGERLQLTARPETESSTPVQSLPKATIFPGTGDFIKPQTAGKPAPKAPGAAPSGSGVTLNFEDASIRDVVKVIFETLKENYVIDPQVQGEVTVQTSRPLTTEQLLPTLETLLRASNAVLVREGGVYRIIPAAGAVKLGNLTPRLGGSRVGYGVRIVPLNYVSALEMQNIIAPMLPDGAILLADATRNLLMLAGTAQELNGVQETINTFDVNWLKGMSIGLFRLRNVDSQAVANELNQLLGEGSGTPVAGLVRLVPLSKLNAVLVITPQKEYLKEVAVWIERLDGIGGERLYIYHVQNSRAEYVAELLNGLFNLGGGSGGGRGGELAPGLKSAQLSSGAGSSGGLSGGASLGGGNLGMQSLSGGGLGGLGGGSGGSSKPSGGASGGSNKSSSGASGGSSKPGSSSLGSGGPSAGMEEVRIVADTENNALLIWATSQNYERIISTLEKMDIRPRQVLIEATFVEVTLSGQLKYGLQWFFNNNVGNGYDGNASLGLSNNLTLANALKDVAANQFSYAITDSGGIVKALLKALAADSKVKVLSSPQVMVLDNQQASIQVGTKTPIPQGTTTVNNVTTSGGVDYEQTGVLLEVLPRINAGGMVNMEIKQQVSEPGTIVELGSSGSSTSSAREFLQRSVTSKVVVKDGQTLVLGGLIRETGTDGQSGIPVLYKVPVLGALFGQTTQEESRTELIVLITPRVVQDSLEAGQVTEEIKRKMQALESVLPAS